ncbi:hypothetical protein PM082_012949 [Marasmius tenuissimus]|nr:hypothetical protein PM082_012949 [Marasmius tenuissimus]
MPFEGAWVIFRRFRIAIFVLCILISLACSTVFSIYCVRNWSSYGLSERIFMTALAAGYGVGGIFLYLVTVAPFRLWIDAARISVYFLLTSSGATIFTFVGREYPCVLGPIFCNQLSVALVIGTWTLSGLLLVYLCCLTAMLFVPQHQSLQFPDTADTTAVPSQMFSSRYYSMESIQPLVSRQESLRPKISYDESYPLTRLSSTASTPRTPSIRITPPYQDPREPIPSTRATLFPAPPVSLHTIRVRPLPLPSPCKDPNVDPSSLARLHPPSLTPSYPGGEWKSRTLPLSRKPPSPLSPASFSNSIPPLNIEYTNVYAREALLSASLSHSREPPSPGYGELYLSLPTPVMVFTAPPTQVVPESVGAEGQWVTWHHPRYDIPRSASASVFLTSPTSTRGM